jgi:hypothetical protein
MKIYITHKQLSILTEHDEDSYSNLENIRGYTFDWDDNILFMPTKIKLLYNDNEIVYVTTEDFAEIRHNPDYELLKDSFKDFQDPIKFEEDIKTALRDKKYGPSFEKFKESLLYANPFAIITARSASPNTIKDGVKTFIGEVFTEDELETMLDNIKRNYKDIALSGEDPTKILELYLDNNEYHPVSSTEFKERFGLSTLADRPEEGKKIALSDYIEKIVSNASYLMGGKYKRLSIGFSDDDKENIESVKELIKSELIDKYPEVNFVIYDTSKGNKNKLVVAKE